MKLDLSPSGLKLFKSCRRAWELKYIHKVIPIQTAEALETGSNYHEMIENYYLSGEIPELTTKESAMARAYMHYIAKDTRMPEFEPEVWFEYKLERGKRIRGRLDGLSLDKKYIIEHKTTSLTIDEFIYNLQWDEQLITYFLATGCREAYYTICRKPTIRQKQNETNEEYALRCLDWYLDDTNNKINVVHLTCTEKEIEEFRQRLILMYKEINTAYKTGNFYRNSCNCTAYGRRCEYSQICWNYDPAQEYTSFRRKSPDENY